MHLIQLCYLSSASRTMSAQDLLGLLQQCLAYNPKHDITGLLLYGNGTFLQALEGEEDVVVSLYDKIEHDKRHVDVKCLHRKTIEKRQYPDWSMGFRRMEEAQRESADSLQKFKKEDFNAEFLAANDGAREDIMSHYASWDPLLREVDKNERHVKHLQEALRRAEGGIEIARLVFESIVEGGEAKGADTHKLSSFGLAQLERA